MHIFIFIKQRTTSVISLYESGPLKFSANQRLSLYLYLLIINMTSRYFDQNSWTEQDDTIYDIKDCLSEELKSCSFQLRDFANWVFSIFLHNIS